MTKFDVAKIYGAQYVQDGQIDFDILADIGNDGVYERMTYTWNPDMRGFPLADHITSLFMSNPNMEIKPYVWKPPTRDQLVLRLKQELKRLNLRDYVEREISTHGAEPVPKDIADKAAFARAMYNEFKDDPSLIPEDWEDAKYWRKE